MSTSQFDILTRNAATKNSISEEGRQSPVIIGIVCTILFHILLYLVAPLLPVDSLSGAHFKPDLTAKKDKYVDFQLAPLPAEEVKPDPMKFVETNPEAPANEPDKTANFSNRNQQTAQEVAATVIDPEKRPSVKGREDVDHNSAIVAGDHAKPQDAAAAPVTPETQAQQEQVAQQAREAQVPLSGIEKNEGLSPDGIASNKSSSETPTNHAAEALEGSKDGKGADGGLLTSAQSSKPQPKPRPKLRQARQNLLTNQIAGTTNVGVLGQDARWSEFGDYMNELVEIVDSEWHGMVDDYHGHIQAGTRVIVTFKLSSDGIPSIIRVELPQDNVTSSLVNGQCQSAITARQPYRKWTQQMITILGNDQTITFGFYYY